MRYLEFEVGDTTWIYVGNHNGELTKGKVVHKFDLPGWSYTHYVVEIPTHIEPMLEVRDGVAMSDSSKKPIGLWRK